MNITLEDDLEPPAFLKLPKPTPEMKEKLVQFAHILIGGQRIWAPIRSAEDIRRRELLTAKKAERGIFPYNPSWPVQVVTSAKENLQLYQNFSEFEKFHDFEDFPFKQLFSAGDVTYIV